MAASKTNYVVIPVKESEESTVLVFNSPPLLIPAHVYQPELKKEYLKFQFDLADIGIIFEDHIDDYVALYVLNQQDHFFLSREYSHLKFEHRSLYYYKKFQQTVLESDLREYRFVLITDEERADFWLEKEGKLLLMNCFEFTSEYDILYFVSNILKQYEIPAKECSLLLQKMSGYHEATLKLLSQYFYTIPFPS